MVLYDEKAELDLEKFDIYNQYRDQICYLKVDKVLFNITIDPLDWQDLKTIVFSDDKTDKIKLIREWFLKVAPEKFGEGKDFDFTDGLFEKMIEELKTKF